MPVLFERDRDLGLLIDRVTGLADHAEGGVVIIEAPPGVGKTQLLAAAIELAQARSVRVLKAHGVELEHELAFGGVRQAATGSRRASVGANSREARRGCPEPTSSSRAPSSQSRPLSCSRSPRSS